MINNDLIASCKKSNNWSAFYTSRAWRKVRKQVLIHDHYECQSCKSKGRYTRAKYVHHIKHLKNFPEYGLEMYYFEDDAEHRNLISVCKNCHENVYHSGEISKFEPKKYLNDEKW